MAATMATASRAFVGMSWTAFTGRPFDVPPGLKRLRDRQI